MACCCAPFREHVVLDPLWTRVWNPAEQDLTSRRIYAGDPSSDDLIFVADREDLWPQFHDQWGRHIAPGFPLHTVRTLCEELKKPEAELNEAVAAARGRGHLDRASAIGWQRALKRRDASDSGAAQAARRRQRGSGSLDS